VRRILVPAVLAVVVATAACGGSTAEPVVTRSVPPSDAPAPPTSSETQSASPIVGATSPAPTIPAGVPATFPADVPSRDLPADELVPPGDVVTSVDRATTAGGQAVVIAFETPGGDPLRRARGFVVWRRDAGADPPWHAVYGLAHGKRDGVLAISAHATDLTDDRSDDALIREETGGSGACATYRVIDLVSGASIWSSAVCDAEIQPNPDPIGLYEVARIYEPGDPHCCPSTIRERILAWNGRRFAVVSEQLTPI
jgi:hypothetical protein